MTHTDENEKGRQGPSPSRIIATRGNQTTQTRIKQGPKQIPQPTKKLPFLKDDEFFSAPGEDELEPLFFLARARTARDRWGTGRGAWQGLRFLNALISKTLDPAAAAALPDCPQTSRNELPRRQGLPPAFLTVRDHRSMLLAFSASLGPERKAKRGYELGLELRSRSSLRRGGG